MIISLVSIKLNDKLDNLPRCGDETVLTGDGKSKMVFHVSCRRLKGHIQKHSDGCSTWE